MLSFIVLAVGLVLGPYAGAPLPGSVPGTAKFAVHVQGVPGSAVRLRALQVPRGYIASFCTDRVCAPRSVTFKLPPAGKQTIELQLVENTTNARPPTTVVVELNGTLRRSIRFTRATH
jgi:stage V sporulation protein SpoVS